jgi:hypothetical protein
MEEVMIKKVMLTMTAMLLAAVWTSSALAMDMGNKRKGKYTYRKVYQACHARGEVDSKTPFLSPADKTQAQWEALYNGKDYSQFKCAEEWSALNDEQVLDIFSYLYSYGSDSPTPAKCK